MGYEYLIPCQRLGVEELDRLLREAPYFTAERLYEYRSELNQDIRDMPEATAQIQQVGIYFCENGGEPQVVQAVLEYLEKALTEAGEHFTQEEL